MDNVDEINCESLDELNIGKYTKKKSTNFALFGVIVCDRIHCVLFIVAWFKFFVNCTYFVINFG